MGFSLFSRLVNWHYSVFFRTHYTFILYLCFLATSFVYMGLGLVYLLDIFYLSFILHLLNLLVLLAFVLFVFNTVSLKHTHNQIFRFSLGTKLNFLALFFAGFSRGIFAFYFLENSHFLFKAFTIIPALLAGVIFAYFIFNFVPIYKNNEFKDDGE